jgi:SHS family sialic acid transporter-like MFS transporter
MTQTRGRWMALTAALLGWMFDGLEMGLFPLVARPAISDLLDTSSDEIVGKWFAVATACFLIGAATGGVLFGWLGDRLGRVRAMTLSVMTYAVFSGLCGFAASPAQIAMLRFVSALGMGGEWALGVALVMEIWPDNSRALLAGLIGAAANFGYMMVAVLGLGLESLLPTIESTLQGAGVPSETARLLVSHSGWRLLLMLGAAPALLTFFIRLFVPESERWQREQGKGKTSHWGARDLGGVGIGALAALGMIWLWATDDLNLGIRVAGSLAALVVITLGFLYPVIRYLQRMGATLGTSDTVFTIRRMLLGACLGGVPLLATWASIQWASVWADQLAERDAKVQALARSEYPPAPVLKVNAKAWTQFWSACGAVLGSLLGALLGGWLGRRTAYSLLCVSALAASLWFFRGNDHFGPMFLVSIFLAGGLSATFYGWLPLYLPELFPTNVRATGQGFSFNFGRVIAAVGALQTSNLMGLFQGGYPEACSIMSMIYLVGLAVIWLAPETKGKPLPA